MKNLNLKNPRINWIEKQLNEQLTPTFLEVIDQGWQHVGHHEEGAGHFVVRIASPKFMQDKKPLPLLACHRLVNKALGDTIGKNIHALQINIQR